MKKFLFTFKTRSANPLIYEYDIEASGIYEAALKARELKSKIEAEHITHVDIQFKGITY